MPNLSPFDNPAQFVVLEPGRPRLLVGTMGQVAVEVVVVADGFGNGQVQHVVLRIAPVGFGQTVSGVFFFGRHFPLVLGDELAVFVVVEAGKGKRIGKGRLKVISDDLDILLDLNSTYACCPLSLNYYLCLLRWIYCPWPRISSPIIESNSIHASSS